MTSTAIIPARGGSVGVPRKNLIDVAGRPLVCWTIEAALGAPRIGDVIVSTDSPEIAEIAQRWGATVPSLRSSELARGNVHAADVVLALLGSLRPTPTVVHMLLPTAPLRTSEDINAADELLRSTDAPSVVGVYRWDKYPTNLRYLVDGYLEPAIEAEDFNQQRQQQRDLYVVSGSIFAADTHAFQRSGTFHMPGTRGLVLPPERCLDINSMSDVEAARSALAHHDATT